ncbi:MAG: hypothetical protein GC136_04205 [Alphaproteobacteria bacterium]|nr:hypothetical protein [Alphaproteobacteria bacterium]
MLPITILLFVGMMPTLAASFMDRSRDKMKVFTVGSLNFATCFPFVLDISTGGFKSDQAINLITDAQNIIIMFSGAVAGYLLEWATVGVVATIVIEQARGKIKSMRNTQEELVERWGKEVRGDIPLDSQGFAIELPEQS